MPRSELIGTILLTPIGILGMIWLCSSIVEHFTPEQPYVCTPHRYERGECLPEVKEGDATRYCPKSLCGDNKWYPNEG